MIARKLIFVLGTRPEAIKMAPLVLKAKDLGKSILVITTGQHPELCASALFEFGIVPDHQLSVIKPNQSLTQLTSTILIGLNDLNLELSDEIIFVQGDTTSAFSAAYFGFLNRLTVVHIEAGLRTSHPNRPFPEEMNRRLISQLASIHFAATENNKVALLKEGFTEDSIFVVGNTVIDALIHFAQDNKRADNPIEILVTLHRRENHGINILRNTEILKEFAIRFNELIKFIVIQHPNPNSQKSMDSEFLKLENVKIIPPQSYSDLIQILSKVSVIVTDSGGLQEEATYLGIPTLIVREETERIEAVESGVCVLVGVEGAILRTSLLSLIEDPSYYREHSHGSSNFGTGAASLQILEIIDKFLEPRYLT